MNDGLLKNEGFGLKICKSGSVPHQMAQMVSSEVGCYFKKCIFMYHALNASSVLFLFLFSFTQSWNLCPSSFIYNKLNFINNVKHYVILRITVHIIDTNHNVHRLATFRTNRSITPHLSDHDQADISHISSPKHIYLTREKFLFWNTKYIF